MYNNLLLYRNELKIKSIPKYKIVGIVTELLYSKKIFSRNSESLGARPSCCSSSSRSFSICFASLLAERDM